MAVISALDLAADVAVDNIQLEEYQDKAFDDRNLRVLYPGEEVLETVPSSEADDRGNGTTRPKMVVVSKYIEAQTDKEFTVGFCIGTKFPYKEYATRVAVHVDGRYADSRIVNWKYKPRGKPYMDTISGRRKNTGGENAITFRFRFLELNIVESGPAIGNEADLGNIQVMFWRVISTKGGDRKGRRGEIRSADDKVSEKRLKKGSAVSHGTGYKSTSACPRMWHPNLEYVDGDDHHFAEIRFKVRRRSALQALGILPRSQSPPEPEAKDVKSKVEKKEPLKRTLGLAGNSADIEMRGIVDLRGEYESDSDSVVHDTPTGDDETMTEDETDDEEGIVAYLGTQTAPGYAMKEERGSDDPIIELLDDEDDDDGNDHNGPIESSNNSIFVT